MIGWNYFQVAEQASRERYRFQVALECIRIHLTVKNVCIIVCFDVYAQEYMLVLMTLLWVALL
jgi:hypothetical protein